jgi:hypothetical protein
LLRIILLVLFSILVTCIYISCGLHTEELGGVGHVAGYKDPAQNCTECHGNDLQGDDDAQSCFACHDQNWE